MAETSDENTTSEQTPEQDATDQPAQAEETDWKAMSRKWEQRAKENRDAAKQLEALRAQSQKDQERIKTLEAEAAKAKAAEQKRAWAARISEKTGVPASLLESEPGDSEDALQERAEQIARLMTARGKGLPDQGATPDHPARTNGWAGLAKAIAQNE